MRIAIVGCGGIAGAHLRAIKKFSPGFELCLCDIDRSRAETIAFKESVSAIYTNIEELLAKEVPDSLHILTPPSTHAQVAEKALVAGCHVILEKPPTDTAKELKDLYALAKDNNRLLCVDHSMLGMPVFLKAKSEIDTGRLGRLVAAHCHFGTSEERSVIPYADPNHWAYRMTGGVLANWASHPASLLLELMDPIQEHKIFVLRRNILPNNCPDLLHVMVKNSDQIGSFTLSMGHGSNERQVQILFENGAIFMDITRQLYYCIRGRGPEKFLKKTFSGIFVGYSNIKGTFNNVTQVLTGKLTRDPGVINVIKSFYGAISSGEKMLVSEQNALGVTELLEKVWREINYRIPFSLVEDSTRGAKPFIDSSGVKV